MTNKTLESALPQDQQSAMDFIRKEMRKLNPGLTQHGWAMKKVVKKAAKAGHNLDGLMFV